MKNILKLHSFQIIVFMLILLLPFLTACQGTFTGYVKNASGSPPLADTRIISDDGYTTCSSVDPNGWYSFDVDHGSRILTYRKIGYKLKIRNESVFLGQTKTLSDTLLQPSTAGKEISGNVGIKKAGVTVKLYQLQCGSYAEIDSVKTCDDGKYVFSGRPDNTEFPDGTYKVAPSCSVCTFSPTYRESIPIPSSPPYDFGATCSPGACQY